MIRGDLLWAWLAVFVVIYSFGLAILQYVLPLVIGAISVVAYLSYRQVYHGDPMGQETTEICTGLLKGDFPVVKRRKKIDQRLTGAKMVDEQLQKLMNYCIRDYVESWYYEHISDDPLFIDLVRECASSVVISFASRSKDVEWLPFFTQRVLDDLVSHLRIFRKALKACHEDHDPAKTREILEDVFFQKEDKTDNQPHFKDICSNIEDERAYLQSIAEMLLYLLLPDHDFQNKTLRFILREVLVENVLIPLANLLSDPDYINGTIIMFCRESSLNPESFITALQTCNMSLELSTIAGCVLQEIERTKQRGSSEEHLEQLSSLHYVNKLCQELCGNISTHDQQTDADQEHGNASLPIVGLRSILTNNSALSYFIDFMSGDPVKQAHVSFWLEAETFHQIMTQLVDKVDSTDDVEEALKKYAINAKSIFDNHFAEEATSRLVLSEETYDHTLEALNAVPLVPDCLANAQLEIFHALEGKDYYEAFLNSRSYRKCLYDMGILSDASQVDVDHSLSTNESVKVKPYRLKAHIPGYVEKSDGGKKPFTCYRIHVTCQHQMGPEEQFIVERRYSDFHNFHLALKAKAKILPPNLTLPIPWSLNKHDPALKESRRKGLDTYLQILLTDDKLGKNLQSYEMIVMFLSESYVRENQYITRKVDSITRPFRDLNPKRLRSSSTNSPGLFRKMLNLPATAVVEAQTSLLSAGLDEQDEENIPLQVMLRLMDEVFELRMKSQGLRRHVTRVLRQFIQATFGGSINRKIIQYVDLMTSPQQIAQYIGSFCDSMWPGGYPAPPAPERSDTTKHITRVLARAKLLGSMPDDLRRFIGTRNTQEGITQVLDLFQYPRLNRRIVYILFEGLLEAIFAQNNVSSVFKRLH